MRIEDREEFVDMVAQAVIDKIEERDRLTGMVDLVVRRVIELQQQQALAMTDSKEETEHAEEYGTAHEITAINGNVGCH